MDFFNSARAAKFFDSDLPRLIKNVGRLADVAEAAVKLAAKGPSAGVTIRIERLGDYQQDAHARVWINIISDTPTLGLTENSLMVFSGHAHQAESVRCELEEAFGLNKRTAE